VTTRKLTGFVLLAAAAAVSLPMRGAARQANVGKQAGPRITVVAGSADAGDGRAATSLVLAGIGGLAVDANGDLYFSDIGRNRVRRVDARTGVLTTVAGTGGVELKGRNGADSADFDVFAPGGLALDGAGRSLFIAEVAGKRVLRVDLAAGKVEDLGGPPLGFGQLVSLLWTPEALLVVDTVEGQVWSHNQDGWKGLFANPGDFPGGIRSVGRDAQGNLVLSEFFGHRILRWDRATGVVSTIAGQLGVAGRTAEQAPAAESLLRTPDGLVVDRHGDIYFSDMNNHRICKIDGATGHLSTIAESRPQDAGSTWRPGPLLLDAHGDLWVGDVYANRVLRFRAGRAVPEVVAGGGADIGDGGLATSAVLAHPGCLALDDAGNLFIADAMTHRVRRVDAASGRIKTVAGTGIPGYNGDNIPAATAQLNYPGGLLVDGDSLYIGDYYSNRVRRVDLRLGTISTIAGNGEAGEEGDGGLAVRASMLNPHALTMDAFGRLIVTSAVEQSVRAIDLKTGSIESVPLDRAMVPSESERSLVFYAVAAFRDGVYLADGMRDQVLFATRGKVAQVVGKPMIRYPMGLAVSPGGDLYISDTRNNRVVRWNGEGVEVVADHLGRPRGIAFDRKGNLYIADTFHNRVLRVELEATRPAAPVASTGARAR
jgi:sugar lactone lactonase YvrE